MAALISQVERKTAGRRALGKHMPTWLAPAGLAVGVALALALPAWGVFEVAKQLSNRRGSTGLPPSVRYTPDSGQPEPPLSLEQELRRVALGFAVAQADGLTLTHAEDLVPTYLPGLSDTAKRLSLVLDDYTVRSLKAVDPDVCRAANAGQAAALSESGRAGMQCFMRGDTAWLAYRSAEARPADRQWQAVSASLRVVGGVPHLLLKADGAVLPQCSAATQAMRGAARLSGQPRTLATHQFCLPAWRWDNLDPVEAGSVVDTGRVHLDLVVAGGGSQAKLSATVRRDGADGRDLEWEFGLN